MGIFYNIFFAISSIILLIFILILRKKGPSTESPDTLHYDIVINMPVRSIRTATVMLQRQVREISVRKR